MKRTLIMMIGASLLVAAFGGTKTAGAQKVNPTSAEVREARALITMKMDLTNLSTAEEVYFTGHGRYTTHVKSLVALVGGDNPFPTPGDSLSPITLVGGGWTATMRNPNTRQVCAIFVETKTLTPPATKEGVPACR